MPSFEESFPPGFEIGEYRVESELGRGGMGCVYAAVHPIIGQRVAIKVLNATSASSPALVERFVNEARADTVFLTLVSSLLYAALALVFAARTFGREQILLGGRASGGSNWAMRSAMAWCPFWFG